jgi:Arc/MetJ family transcription regulator
VIFKQVGDERPYPDHARTTREWAEVPPRPVRLDQLITTKAVLDLRLLLSKESTFYGDLFPHVVQWHGELYLEDGLHRALGAALHQRSVLHARVLDLDAGESPQPAPAAAGPARATPHSDGPEPVPPLDESAAPDGYQRDSQPRDRRWRPVAAPAGPHRPKHSRRRSEHGDGLAG